MNADERRCNKVISVSIEKGLLKQSDGLARRLGISRARLVARGLRAVLAAEGITSSSPLR
jgi:metal-responsive CopG/Arc/MetJ family transcriptional regulator